MNLHAFNDISGKDGKSIVQVASAHAAHQPVAASATYLADRVRNDTRYAWATNLDEVSRRAHQAEHGKNPVAGFELKIGYNPRLPEQMNAEIVEWFAQIRSEQGGVVHLIRFKEPVTDGAGPPYNAVLIETTRQLTPEGFGEKTEAAREGRGDEPWDDPAINAHMGLDDVEDIHLLSIYESERPGNVHDPRYLNDQFGQWKVEKGYQAPLPSAEELQAQEAKRWEGIRNWQPGNPNDDNPTQSEFDKWYASALRETRQARENAQEPRWGIKDLLQQISLHERRQHSAAVREEYGDTLSDQQLNAEVESRTSLKYVAAPKRRMTSPKRRSTDGSRGHSKDSASGSSNHVSGVRRNSVLAYRQAASANNASGAGPSQSPGQALAGTSTGNPTNKDAPSADKDGESNSL